jgi:electron transfer flavoprotein beta subunit
MGISHIMNVVGFEITDGKMARVKQNVESGNSIYKVALPAVIAVERTINTVRYPNVMETLKAKTKPLNTLTAADLTKLDEEKIGLSGSTTQAGELIAMEFHREGELIEGSEEEIAEQIIEKINSVI